MKLRERIEGVLGSTPAAAAEQRKQRTISDLRRRIDELTRGRAAQPIQRPAERLERVDIEGLVQGRVEQTPAGPVFVSEHRYPLGWDHGRLRLERLFDAEPAALALLGAEPGLAALDLRRALFFDTETTGLAGGTGTYAFLVGLGAFEADEFVVRQVFMRDFCEEAASLHVVAQQLESAAFLVSFNGKTFDAPLLNTRLVMNRLPAKLGGLPHLDLLHPARRLYRERCVDCRLGTLEQHALGFERNDDVPGFMVPDLYRAYLRSRDGRHVAKVFTHNALDVLSLVTLTAHLAELVWHGAELGVDPGLLLAAARLLRDRGRVEQAQRCFELALERAHQADPLTARDARVEVALAHKRRGEHACAAEHFRVLIQNGPFDPLAFEELAKHLEHRDRDLAACAELTERALQFLRAGAFTERREHWISAFEHRLARLQHKLGQ